MHTTDWEQFRKTLQHLPLEQVLRLLRESLQKEKDAKTQEKIKAEIALVQKTHEQEVHKSEAPPLPSKLVELAEERPEPQQREREESLEETVGRTPVALDESPQQRDYLSGGGQEYKRLGEDDQLYHSGRNESGGQRDFNVRDERMKTEGERAWEQSDPTKQTETYKKKRTS